MDLPALRPVAAVAALLLGAGCHSSSPPAGAPSPDEQVNVGYGTQDAANLTGSVSSLTSADLERAPASNMERMLRGRVPGLRILRIPGGDVSLSIRGTGPARESRPPHVVIDGSPASARDLLALAPDVVARIDILKDAAASVYGMRGANGVILVTTKRAR